MKLVIIGSSNVLLTDRLNVERILICQWRTRNRLYKNFDWNTFSSWKKTLINNVCNVFATSFTSVNYDSWDSPMQYMLNKFRTCLFKHHICVMYFTMNQVGNPVQLYVHQKFIYISYLLQSFTKRNPMGKYSGMGFSMNCNGGISIQRKSFEAKYWRVR